MTSEPFDFMAFKRPVKALASYYLLISLFALPAFPIVWLAGTRLWPKDADANTTSYLNNRAIPASRSQPTCSAPGAPG